MGGAAMSKLLQKSILKKLGYGPVDENDNWSDDEHAELVCSEYDGQEPAGAVADIKHNIKEEDIDCGPIGIAKRGVLIRQLEDPRRQEMSPSDIEHFRAPLKPERHYRVEREAPAPTAENGILKTHGYGAVDGEDKSGNDEPEGSQFDVLEIPRAFAHLDLNIFNRCLPQALKAVARRVNAGSGSAAGAVADTDEDIYCHLIRLLNLGDLVWRLKDLSRQQMGPSDFEDFRAPFEPKRHYRVEWEAPSPRPQKGILKTYGYGAVDGKDKSGKEESDNSQYDCSQSDGQELAGEISNMEHIDCGPNLNDQIGQLEDLSSQQMNPYYFAYFRAPFKPERHHRVEGEAPESKFTRNLLGHRRTEKGILKTHGYGAVDGKDKWGDDEHAEVEVSQSDGLKPAGAIANMEEVIQ